MFDAGVWRYKVVTARKPGDADPAASAPAEPAL
ncbi:hypothetical protein SVIOM342S_02846 [Streptomyces violaceorubidus]